MFPLQI